MTKLTRQDIYATAKELSNWGRWGADDQIGTLNNVTPEDVIRAAGLVKKGKCFALGLNLKEDAVAKTVVIESIEKGSNADLAGVFAAGDRLVACSAVMMVTEEEAKSGMIYNRDARGKKGGCCSTGCSDCPFNARNWQRVMFDCRGKNFETAIAALQSNFQARWLARGAAQDVSITVTVER